MSEKRYYTVQKLQEILGVSRPTIYNLLKKKEFRGSSWMAESIVSQRRVSMTGSITMSMIRSIISETDDLMSSRRESKRADKENR